MFIHITAWILIIIGVIIFVVSALVMFCNLYLSSKRLDEQDDAALQMIINKYWKDNVEFKPFIDDLKDKTKKEKL